MKKITKEELNDILEKHKKWLNDEEGGERAILDDVDLDYASLDGASLNGAFLDRASLRGASLNGAFLDRASLRGASLDGASLYRASLRGASLDGASLYRASLNGAFLDRASLNDASLDGASLDNASLDGASLYRASLDGASLNDASLDGASLDGTSLNGARCLDYPIACPDEGEFIGFKKARSGYIVKLKITDDAKRSSSTGRKCRCSKALVLSITKTDGTDDGTTKIASGYDKSFIYRVGEIVEVSDFCEDRWQECAPGIHFFITRKEAERYKV